MSTAQTSEEMLAYFKAIAEQQDEGGGGGGEFFKKGKYKLTLKQASARKGYKGFSLSFMFRVDEAIKTGDSEPNAPGSTAKLILKTNDPGKKGTMAKINSQRLVRALFNLPENVSPSQMVETAALLTSPGQPGRGMAIQCDAYETTTESGKVIVATAFLHDPKALDRDEVGRRRASLDAGE